MSIWFSFRTYAIFFFFEQKVTPSIFQFLAETKDLRA